MPRLDLGAQPGNVQKNRYNFHNSNVHMTIYITATNCASAGEVQLLKFTKQKTAIAFGGGCKPQQCSNLFRKSTV